MTAAYAIRTCASDTGTDPDDLAARAGLCPAAVRLFLDGEAELSVPELDSLAKVLWGDYVNGERQAHLALQAVQLQGLPGPEK